MSHLAISLFGPFRVTRDGEPVARFEAETARALLAYLTIECERPHRREALAGLLWPERPDSEALRNLRVALSRLRDAIGDREAAPPFLHITRKTLQFNAEGDYWLDVRAFSEAIAASKRHGHRQLEGCASCMQRLGEAAELYRGDFLQEFSLPSASFEEWLVVQREALHLQALDVLHRLAAYHEGRGEYDRALHYARWQVELEPWRESAHRQWMRALALSGQRGAALVQYEACRRILIEELGIEPEAETRAFYEHIREGMEAPAPSPPSRTPVIPPSSILGREAKEVQAPSPLALLSVELEGERRLVTVVLADVSGSTELLERVGTEAWAGILSPALQTLRAEAHRYGGEVDQYRGDGLVVTFGATIAHEDDPERAVLAALAMQEAFRTYVGELAELEGIKLLLQVGVNTGEMIVASISEGAGAELLADAKRPTAIGEAIAVAERMQAAVEPGTVWVSENTYHLVELLFEWGSLGGIAVKGVSQPVSVYRPLAHRGLPGKGRGIAGLESPLVGRQSELCALQEMVGRLWTGVGGIVTLVGEAGIGKSRLVAEVRKQIGKSANGQIANLQWIEGRCLSYATSVAYQVWLDMLRSLLGVAPEAPPDVVRDALRKQVGALCVDRSGDVYPYLGRMMSLPLSADVEAKLRGLDAEGLKVVTFRAVKTLVECAAQWGPLVIVCEDLHWADPTSIELLDHLLALTDHVPLLFICVFRPEMSHREMGHGCWHIKETATRRYHHRHTDLWLGPLSAAEGATLVSNLLYVEDLHKELRQRILDRAEGNPFYVEEILRSLIGGGVLGYDEATGRWQVAKDVSSIAIPDTLHGVLMARMDRLPQEVKRVLQLASVIGRIFSYPLLAAIAERSKLDDHLVTLQRAQMIRERARVPEVEYIFEHQLTMEAAYEGLLRVARRVLHRRAAEALERLYPERIEEQLGLVAHHWGRAGERGRAIFYLRRAGEQAAAQFANAEAVGYLSRALDLTLEADLETRYDLLLTREKVYDLQGDREAQWEDLGVLQELCDALDDGRRQAEVALLRARYAIRIGDYSAAIAAARQAIHLSRAAQDVASEAAGHREWGRALYYQQDCDAARLQLEQALAQARAARTFTSPLSCSGQGSVELLRQVEVDSLHTLGAICLMLDDCAKGRVYFEEELRICREIGNQRSEGEALRDLGFVAERLGDYAGAKTYLEQSLHVCRETGNRRDEGWALFVLGHTFWQQGDCAGAREHLEQALCICHETRARAGESWSLFILGDISRGQGDYVGAKEYLEQMLRIGREIGNTIFECWALRWLGCVSADLGDYAGARTYIEQALHIWRELGFRLDEVWDLAHLGLFSRRLGDDEAAEEYAQQAQHLAHDLRDRHIEGEALGIWGIALVALGHLLASLGQLTEAVDAYRQALEIRRELNQPHWAMEPQAGLASISLAEGDLVQALAHVEEILGYLKAHPMPDGMVEPFQVYLTCYRVLRANGDPRAKEIMDVACRLLQERAKKIDDEALRRSYLENVAAHREIVAEYTQGS
jgi:DNA-binding SARP family transcriptional activator/class 3 adenylate cyclase